MERNRENLSVNSSLLPEKVIQEIAKDTGANIREVGVEEVLITEHGYSLEFGRKRLLLNVDDANCHFNTHIQNIRDEKEKLPEETSTLYQAAKRLMEVYVEQKQESYNYIFMTDREDEKGNKNVLYDWALARGKEIFNWEKIEGSDREELECTKTFYYKK